MKNPVLGVNCAAMGSFQSGSQVGSYRILAPIGAGGMGEVYHARDTKLKRDVAIKVLPAEFASDADRLARAQREAEVLASLNHQNIAQIYGQEEAGGTSCLVLEYVDGETLEERIKQGPIPLAEALELARQIADALDAAHERGIVNRDLKPANVKITPAGKVKVLDFGLAKALETGPVDVALPTLVGSATGAGVILGTSAYMSPEQAKGKPADTRSDIWAFGVVLYEMLAGKAAFHGETVVEILGGVLKSDPDWTALPATIPQPLLNLLRHCLQKDRNRRLRHIADARFQLEQALHEPGTLVVVPEIARQGLWMWPAAAFAGIIAAVGVGLWHFGSAPVVMPETRLQIVTPPSRLLASFAISPDGRKVVYEAISPADGKDQLHLRKLESENAQVLAGTEGASSPFWSPDSRSIAFFADGKLKRIDLAGGAPQTLADVPISPAGAWNADGTNLFDLNSTSPLQRISVNGGPITPVTTLDPPRQVSHRFPQFLPDGRTVTFTRTVTGNIDIWLIDTMRRVLRRFTSDPADDYVSIWSPDGRYIAYRSRKGKGNLNIFRKAADGTGDDALFVESAENKLPLDWSADGHYLLYAAESAKTGSDIYALSVDDRKSAPVAATNAEEFAGRFSPDGGWIAFGANETGRSEIYVQPFPGTGGKSAPISTNGGTAPQWRPDGKEMFYLGLDNRVMSVPVTLRTNAQIDAGTPMPLFSLRPGSEFQVVDGQRFLIDAPTEGSSAMPITLILNWAGRRK
jgi:serine/threonine-protein kinase